MAVTVTYSWIPVTTFDLDLVSTAVDLTALANGGFAASGDVAGHVDGVFFNANGVRTGGWTNSTGASSALDQLSNGNIVLAGQDPDSIRYEIRDGAGASVLASTDIGNTSSTDADVVALAGGGFWVAAEDLVGAGNTDIVVNRYDNSGAALGSFTVSNVAAADFGVALAALDGGGVAMAWTRANGALTQMWCAVYDASGAVVRAPTLVDNVGTVNRNVGITPLNGGGFAMVHEDSSWSNTMDITLGIFTANGTVVNGFNVSNPLVISDGSADLAPSITRLSNGMIVVSYSNNAAAHTDTIVRLIDPATGGVLATDVSVTAGQPLSNDVENSVVAGLLLGRVAVAHSNVTSGNAEGEVLQAVRTTTGDGADDVATGDDLVDLMNGAGGADTLSGGANNDVLNGGDGNDALDGGAGDDTASYADAATGVTVTLATAGAQNTVGAGTDTLTNIEFLTGSAFNDTLTGSAGFNQLAGGAGDDVLRGGLGDDILDGAGGQDFAAYDTVAGASAGVVVSLAIAGAQNTGGAGTDTLSGFEGVIGSSFNDFLTANNAGNLLDGLGGDDYLFGGAGIDALFGGDGNDAIYGGDGGDIITTGNGTNYVEAGQGADQVSGGNGTDIIYGIAGNDVLNGGDGDDSLYGAFGAFTLIGGNGTDLLQIDNSAGISVSGGAGSDYLVVGTTSAVNVSANDIENWFGYTNNDTFNATGNAALVYMRGADGNDTLTGGTGGDYLYGDNGDDVLNGGDGNDVLIGGAGTDTLNGGDGTDLFYVGASDVNFNGDAGIDYVVIDDPTNAGVSIGLSGRGVEYVYGRGGDDFINGVGVAVQLELHGDDGADIIQGGSAVNILLGEGGNDLLIGNASTDHFVGGAGADTVRAGAGSNYFYDYQDGADKMNMIGLAPNFAALTIDNTYAASNWYGVNYASGVLWVNTGGAGALDATDFIF